MLAFVSWMSFLRYNTAIGVHTVQTYKLALSLFLVISLSYAQESAPQAPNSDIETLVYYPAPEVNEPTRELIQNRVIFSLYSLTKKPQDYLTPEVTQKLGILKANLENDSAFDIALVNTQSAIELNTLSTPESFFFVFKTGKGLAVEGSYVQALVFVPDLTDPSLEYRYILEAPARTEQGKRALNVLEAINDSFLREFKVVQIKSCNRNEVLSEIEAKILEADHDSVTEI